MKLVIDISEEDFKFIKGLRLALGGRGYAQELQRNVINAIRNGTPLPTVDITEEQAIDKLHETGWMQRHDKEMTKRPTGEWVHDYDDFYHCSICKRSIITTLTRPTDLFPFCHCGAEMKEAENE